MTFFIDLRADSAGGNPVASFEDVIVRTDVQPNPNPANPLDLQLLQAVKGREILLGVHGFNVDRTSGISNLSHWSEWLQLGSNGLFVGILWPGDARWVPVVDYPIEGNEAIRSGKLLAQYLSAHFTTANSISFVSHSLGARVVLETVRNLPSSLPPKTVTLMAGAIDDTCLSVEYQDAAATIGKICVLASQCDDVLEFAFPVGNPISGVLTRGSPYWHGALGRYGPNPPDSPRNLWKTRILPDTWDFGHHSYINCAGLATGPPLECGPFAPSASVVPQAGSPCPTNALNWQQAWAAGFTSIHSR
jgi:hypothetical protein